MRIIPPQCAKKHGCKPALNLSPGSCLVILVMDFSILSSSLIITMHDRFQPGPFSDHMSLMECFKGNLQPATERHSMFCLLWRSTRITESQNCCGMIRGCWCQEGHKYTCHLLNCTKIRKHPLHVINLLMGAMVAEYYTKKVYTSCKVNHLFATNCF